MARLRFEDGMFTLVDGSITARFDVNECDLKDVRDFLLERYPLETASSPLCEVSLEDARQGDIATFENYGDGYACTVKQQNGDLVADTWLMNRICVDVWRIRLSNGDKGGLMRDLRIWRWSRHLELKMQACEKPEPEPGIYITRDRKTVLLNDGDMCRSWSKIKPIEDWDNGCRWTDWDVVMSKIGHDNLPLIRIEDTGILAGSDEHGN